MKRKIPKICCIWFIFISLILSISYAETTTSNGTKKVLDTAKREVRVEKEIEEEIIGECFEAKEKIANEESRNLLNYLHISLDEQDSVSIVKKDGEKVNRFVKNNYEIDFNQDGEIDQIKNYDDLFTDTSKARTNYDVNEKIEKIEYQYDTKESIQPIIDEIQSNLDLEQYRIVECHNQLEGTWLVVWNKVMENDIENPFDVVVISIDAKDGSIMVFDRGTETPDCNISIIDYDKALKCAEPILQKVGQYEEMTSKLTVVRPNFYWEDVGPYESADFIRIAWVFNLDETVSIYIDAETGEILGGTTTFGYGYRSFSTVPEWNGGNVPVILAARAFQRLRLL